MEECQGNQIEWWNAANLASGEGGRDRIHWPNRDWEACLQKCYENTECNAVTLFHNDHCYVKYGDIGPAIFDSNPSDKSGVRCSKTDTISASREVRDSTGIYPGMISAIENLDNSLDFFLKIFDQKSNF